MYHCADGPIMLVVGNNPQFVRLSAAMGVPQLASDERFVTNQARIKNRGALNDVLMPIFASQPKKYWIEMIGQAGVPCGPVNQMNEVFEDPQVKEREMVVTMKHPQRGDMPLLANPIKFSGTPVQYRLRPPDLGEHTDDVLSSLLGYDEMRLGELRSKGVI